MIVYVEYAFVENFVLDTMLLYLSFRAAKVDFKWKKLLFSAAVGAIFALLFPLLSLPDPLASFLKFFVGFLLCLLCFDRFKWGKYAFVCVCFFGFSFAFAGAIFAVYNGFSHLENGYKIDQAPVALVLCGGVGFTLLTLSAMKKFYRKRALHSHLYPCKIRYNERSVNALGFLDSGNMATRNGLPVCFVSPDITYELWENELAFSNAVTREEITVLTVGGEKTLPLFKGELTIQTPDGVFERKEVYFSPSAHIVSREYKILLQSCILEV